MINCPFCGKLTDPKLENCPHCGGSTPSRPAAHPVKRAPRRGRQTCPNCRALVQDGDIICLVCGTNLLTGQKVTEEAAPQSDRRLWIAAGGVLTVAIIAVGALWVYAVSGDPLERAKRLTREGDFLQAQDVLSEYLEKQPDDDRALFELGKLQWQGNRYAEAADSFERAANRNPALEEAALWSVLALARSGQSKATRSKQVSLLDRLARRDANSATLAYLLGLALSVEGGEGAQAEQLQRAADLDPTDISARWGLGIALALSGDYQAAERELRMAEDSNRSGDTLAARGFLASLAGDSERAIKLLSDALEAQGLSFRWQTETELGKLLVEEGRFQEAEAHLAEAVLQKRTNDLARYLSGVCAQALNRPRDALVEFGPLSSRPGPYSSDSAVQIANIRLNEGNVSGAEDAIKRAAGSRELNASFYTVQGRIYAVRNRSSAARESFRKAIELDPNFAPAYLENGLLHIKNNELKLGLQQLERYVSLLGTDIVGTRAYEVRTLIRQLHQTVGGSGDDTHDVGTSAIAERIVS